MYHRSISLCIALTATFGFCKSTFGQTGACCNDTNGVCDIDVDISLCSGPNQRFDIGNDCGVFLNPPCGMGACCFDNETCALTDLPSCPIGAGAYAWTGGVICADIDCRDCNNNMIPDSIDLADCVGDPACGDCNSNGIPDGCDINDCLPGDPDCDDCNSNGIPDECDITDCLPGDPACDDCNGNGIPDACDITDCLPGDRTCDDCNGNNKPDECEVPMPAGICVIDCLDDCNIDGVPDICEIDINSSAPGGPYFCTAACDPDCNTNGIPDECDISGGGSDDLIAPFGTPDECIFWSGPLDGDWHNASNWTPSVIPDNGADSFSVVIDDTFVTPPIRVVLDADAAIDTLQLLDDAELALSVGSLTLEQTGGIVNQGTIIIADNRSLLTGNTFTVAGGTGEVQLAGANAAISSTAPGNVISSKITIRGQGLIDADFVNERDADNPGVVGLVSADVSGGVLLIENANNATTNNGVFEATGGGTLSIQSDVTETAAGGGAYRARGGTVIVGDKDDGDVVDGCGPLDVLVQGQAGTFELNSSSVNGSNSWAIGSNLIGPLTATMTLQSGSSGTVAGPTTVLGNGVLNVLDSTFTTTSLILAIGSTLNVIESGGFAPGGPGSTQVTVSEALEIKGSDEAAFFWGPNTRLELTGGAFVCSKAAWTTLEAGGLDLGPSDPSGYDENFDFSEIVIADGARVLLVDDVDNGNRDGPFGSAEAVYADDLLLGTDARILLNNLRLYVNGLEVTPFTFPGQVFDGSISVDEACCLSNNNCTDTPSFCCEALLGGLAQGPVTVCSPIRACCLPDDACAMLDPLCCEDLGGTDLGAGTTCSTPEGCCLLDDTCATLDPACCALIGGTSQGAGNVCSLTEACCIPGQGCFSLDPLCCEDLGGMSQGPGTSCSPAGACCFPLGKCSLAASVCCTAMGGEPQGAGISCLDAQCSGPPTIPTVSEWGLIVLTLLLLAAGTIVYRRRPAVA
ncbi:MAG: IPTL-CTERM sorting domain-containing protein [Planctomycetota bacterium]|nr:IPTL-CTERM sorting domain-containing protein [Planctomycetota bacterium]